MGPAMLGQHRPCFKQRPFEATRRHRRRSTRAEAAQPGPGPSQAQPLARTGPADAPPDYAAIDAQLLNRAVYGLFRARMARQLGQDSKSQG